MKKKKGMPKREEDSRHVDKEVVKEALKEWLDEKFATFGRWSFGTFAAAVFGALTYFILMMGGWQRVKLAH